jgi:hypothetical protein
MTCPQNAVPHILARAFNGIGDSDPDEGFDPNNDFQPDDQDFEVFNICDNTTLVKCQPCGALPQAYHAFNSFRVFENTNAPFQPRAEPYIVDIIKCSDFDGFFSNNQTVYFNSAFLLADICQYATTNSLPPFTVKVVGSGGAPIVPIFNVYADCNALPIFFVNRVYTIFFNGLNCGKQFQGPSPNMLLLFECLTDFDFTSVTSSLTYQNLATQLCAFINANCVSLLNNDLQVDLIDSSGIVQLIVLTVGCVTTPVTTNFVVGQTYQLKINDGLFKIFTVTS